MISKKWKFHVIIWVCYFVILQFVFSISNDFTLALYRSLKTVVFHAFIFYFNTEILIPKFYDKNKIGKYIVSVIILLSIMLCVVYLVDMYALKGLGYHLGRKPHLPFRDIMPRPRRPRPEHFHKPVVKVVMQNLTPYVAIIALGIAYKIIVNNIKKEHKKTQLNTQNLLNEMKFLKSQINPHFLFNSLNNIYTLVYIKHDHAPKMLMKLSEMLRYMLYECNADKVPIEKEICYIENYIDLQSLKTEQKQNIKTNYNVSNGGVLVPPLLFIPFIENSFKHSGVDYPEYGWVDIQLTATNKVINFKVTNSLSKVKSSSDEVGGIGLENVRRQLELLYPNKYSLVAKRIKSEYKVVLKITLDED